MNTIQLASLGQTLRNRFGFAFRVTEKPEEILFTSTAGKDYRLALTFTPGRFKDLGLLDLTLKDIADPDRRYTWTGLTSNQTVLPESVVSVVKGWERPK